MAKDKVYVPIEPFSAWLRWMSVVYGDYVAVALRVGCGESAIRRWANNKSSDGKPTLTISLAAVDRVLVAADMDETIWSLYPDLDLEPAA